MKRGPTGRHQVTTDGGEQVRAFIPVPLPPKPPIVLDGAVQRALEPALLALGRLDAISSPPSRHIALPLHLRPEGKPSCRRRSKGPSPRSLTFSCSNVEDGNGSAVPEEDVLEVSNYVAAMDHGMRRMRGGFPLSNRLRSARSTGVLDAERTREYQGPREFQALAELDRRGAVRGTPSSFRRRSPRSETRWVRSRNSLHEEAGNLPLLNPGRTGARPVRKRFIPSSTATGALAGSLSRSTSATPAC